MYHVEIALDKLKMHFFIAKLRPRSWNMFTSVYVDGPEIMAEFWPQ